MAKPFTTLVVLLLFVAAAAHVYRLAAPFDVVVNGTIVPPWASIAAAIGAVILALMVLRESRR